MEKEVVTGIVQRVMGKNVSVNLGKADGVLSENEQVKGEEFKPTERIKFISLKLRIHRRDTYSSFQNSSGTGKTSLRI